MTRGPSPVVRARSRYSGTANKNPSALLFLTEEETAEFLGTDTDTLTRWRCQGRGPNSRVIGGARLSLEHDVDLWHVQHGQGRPEFFLRPYELKGRAVA